MQFFNSLFFTIFYYTVVSNTQGKFFEIVYNQVNALCAIVEFTNHLGFEPGFQGAELKMALEIDPFS